MPFRAQNKGIPGVWDSPFCRRTTQYQSQCFHQPTSQKLIKDLQKYAMRRIDPLRPEISGRFAGNHHSSIVLKLIHFEE